MEPEAEEKLPLTFDNLDINDLDQVRKWAKSVIIRPPEGYDVQTTTEGIPLTPDQQIERFLDNTLAVLSDQQDRLKRSEPARRQLLKALVNPLTQPKANSNP